MKIDLPEKVSRRIREIEDAGFEAYAVGGCVRDFLLSREPKDWDITTDALPKDIKKIFRRTVDTGIAHGTVTVLLGKEQFEVTTFRIDGKYSDGRHPDKVEFTPNLEEDLKRRDFTINALAYNPEKGIIDLFGGMEDLKNKTIRAVGVPEERFGEDALRILRAFRFSAQLEFNIEEDTRKAASDLADTLKKISAERIRDELTKLLTSDHPEKFRELYDNGITAVIMPEFDESMEVVQNNPHHLYTVGVHILESLKYITKEKLEEYRDILPGYEEKKDDMIRLLRFTMLFHDLGKGSAKTTDSKGIDHFYGHADKSEEMTVEILKRLKSDNRSINLISGMVRYHDYRPESSKKTVRKTINKMGEEIFSLLFPVRYADIMAQSDHERKEKLDKEEALLKLYKEILEDGNCLSLKDMQIDGGTLIKEAGMKPGKELGEMLQFLLNRVLEEPQWNTRENLLMTAKERLIQQKNGTE